MIDKILKKSIIVSVLLCSVNSFGFTGMTSPEYLIAKKATDALQWAVEKAENASQWATESAFHEKLTNLSLENQIFSQQVGFNGNKVYDAVLQQTSKLGGPYSTELAGIMDSCFGIELPSFSKSLGLDGFSFCGVGDVSSILNRTLKGKALGAQGKNENNVEKQKELTLEQATTNQPKTDSSKINCNEQIDASCKAKKEEQVKEETEKGVAKDGGSSTMALKQASLEKAANIGNEQDKNKEDVICTHNEQMIGSTESYACKKDVVNDMKKQEDDKSTIANSNSKLIDAKEREVRNNMLKANEEFAENVTSRVNTSREIRDDYNIRYNPSKTVIDDVKNFGERSFYQRNKDYLSQDPTLYIVPTIKNNQFSLAKYGLDNYGSALKEFNNIKLEDVDGNPIETPEQIQNTIKRLGGVTPFSSALYSYDLSLAVMAKSVYDGTIEKAGEQGEIGREMAIVHGLKGVMLQTMLVNQQIENMTRSNYNIRLKEFDKISSDNDNVKNKLDQIQNQNALIIDLLKQMNISLAKIANK